MAAPDVHTRTYPPSPNSQRGKLALLPSGRQQASAQHTLDLVATRSWCWCGNGETACRPGALPIANATGLMLILSSPLPIWSRSAWNAPARRACSTRLPFSALSTPPRNRPAAMLSIQRSSAHSGKCTPNLLPCRIEHNGPVNAADRFWRVEEKDGGGCKTAGMCIPG